MSTPPRFRRLFSCLGCLVAGPLGCLSFLGGGVLVALIFLPEIGEQLILKRMPAMFREQFMGELSVESIDLAWTSVQRIEGILLLDDQGRTILSGSAELPPLLAWDSSAEGLGLSTLKLNLDVAIDETGRSNFDRALTLKKNANELSSSATYSKFDLAEMADFFFESKGRLNVEIEQFAWTIEGGTERSGFRARDVSAKLEFNNGAPLVLVANGLIEGLASNGSVGSMVLRTHIERGAFFPSKAGGQPGVWGALIAKDIPTKLLRLLPLPLEFEAIDLGEQSNFLFSIEKASEGDAPLQVTFNSGSFHCSASGELQSAGLLAIYPLLDEVEQVKLSGRIEGLSSASIRTQLPFDVLGESGVQWAWREEQPVEFRIENLAWVRRGEQPVTGSFALTLPDTTVEVAPGRSFDLFQSELRFARDESLAWNGTATGFLGATDRGEFTIDLEIDQIPGETGGYGLSMVAAHCLRIPIEQLDQSLGMNGRFRGALGNTANLRTNFHTVADEAGPFTFVLQSERTSADFEGQISGRPRTIDDWLGALDFHGSLGAGGSEWLAPIIFGAALDWSDGVDLDYAGWRPRNRSTSDELAARQVVAGPAGAEHPKQVSGGSLNVSVPKLTYRSLSDSQDEFELKMSEVTLFAHGDSGSLRVDFSADVESGGTLQKHWIFYGLRGPFGRYGNEDLRLRAESYDFSSAVLDERYGTDGLIASIFGPVVDFELKGEGLSADGGRLRCLMNSDRARLTLTGFRKSGDLMTDVELTLECELDQAVIARLVQPLLPMVQSLTASKSGTAKLRLVLEQATFSLVGDLDQLAGKLRLDLGSVAVAYTDRFSSFLVKRQLDDPPRPALVKPIQLVLGAGRIACDFVELPVQSHSTRFEGSYGFGGTDLDLQIELPLSMVGGEANLVLDNLRENFRPDFGVPLVISGAELAELDMSVRPQWFRTVSDIMDQFVPEALQNRMRELLSEDEAK